MTKQTKVGMFVLAGLLLSVVIVFTIGDNRRLWDPKIPYMTSFGDVGGLKPGAPIIMGGVDIGSVSSVAHSGDSKDPRIYVKLSVARSESSRVRADSVAHVLNKGLLGDKMVEITVGDPKEDIVPPGGTLKSEDPLDISKYIAKFESIANKTEATVENLQRVSQAIGTPEFSDDVRGTAKALHEILDGVAHNQDGAAHKLIFDPEEGKRLDLLLTNLDGMAGQLNGAAADLHDVTTQVKTGNGLAHALVYDDDARKSAVGALSEAHAALEAVRTGNGLAHAVVYGDDNTQRVMGNLNTMSEDLRVIVANVRAGKGTIGALLVDPSVYEDIKSLVGNVERNQVLRALVRYSIKEDEQKK